MTDMLDLQSLSIVRSPDVRDWPITLAIVGVDMDPVGGLTLHFDHAPPASWKFPSNPEKAADNIQFTVWACVVKTALAGFVQMWEGRPMGDRSLPPILSGYHDWWGDPRHLWGVMSDYVPTAGDTLGLMVTAGNARLTWDVTSVRERSQLVTVALPADDRGSFRFDVAPAPQPQPKPLPPSDDVKELLGIGLRLVEELVHTTTALGALTQKIDELEQRGLRVRL